MSRQFNIVVAGLGIVVFAVLAVLHYLTTGQSSDMAIHWLVFTVGLYTGAMVLLLLVPYPCVFLDKEK